MKVAPGDTVHVKGTVVVIRNGQIGLVAVSFSGILPVWIAEGDIVHVVEHAPLKVGDRVRWSADGDTGVIVAIDANQAWVRGNGHYGIYDLVTALEKLERA